MISKVVQERNVFLKFYSYCSYQEFLEQTKKPDFERDEGWQGLDEQQIYSQQEYEAYERRRQEEVQKMIAKGMVCISLCILSALKNKSISCKGRVLYRSNYSQR